MKKYFLLSLFVCPSAFAQTLSWEKSVELMREKNPDLRAAQANLQSSEYLLSGTNSAYWPQLSASLAYSNGNETNFVTANSTTYSSALTASYNLFNGFQDIGKAEVAQSSRDQSEAALQIVKAKASAALKTAYSGLSFAFDSINLQKDIIRRREEHLHMVELRFDGGHENLGSVQLAKANLSQAKYDELQAEGQVRVARIQLAAVLGIEDSSNLNVQEKVPAIIPPKDPDYRHLVRQMPEYRQANSQEASTLASIKVARSQFYPVLALSGSVGRLGSDVNTMSDRWSAGATVTFPFFSGFRDYYTSQSASENYRAAKETKKSSEEALLGNLEQAHLNLSQAYGKLDVDKNFQDAARTRSKIARSKYNNGLLSFDDWDIIENDLIARERAYLQAQKDLIAAQAAWEQSLGQGVIQ